MRFRWFAASSLLLCALAAAAAGHPRYGGTLRVQMRAAPISLDPTDEGAPLEAAARARLAPLLFDTLYRVDARGRVRPHLASTYQLRTEAKYWRFTLAPGVKFSDGTPMTAAAVAESLAAGNPDWRVRAEGDTVVIETSEPFPAMTAELALPRNSIVRRATDGTLVGTGPFAIAEWRPGQSLTLRANEDCWQGRPFVDAVEIAFGRNPREQSLALELGRADIVELSSDQPRNPAQRAKSSSPMEVFAVAFDRLRVPDARLREAVSLAVDRPSMARGVFQGSAEATASVAPQWVSGYSFLFPTPRNVQRARQVRGGAPAQPIVLAYAPNDGLARMVAERVALNARDAGINIQPTPSNAAADARIVRLRVASPDVRVALQAMARSLGQPLPRVPWTVDDAYAAERGLLKDFLLVPVVAASESQALGPRVKNWWGALDGAWHLEDVWVQP